MNRGVCIGVVSGTTAATAAQWRDTTLAAALERVRGVRGRARYTAFNQPRAVLHADIADIDALTPGTLPTPEPPLALTLYRARQTGEFRQPGNRDDPATCPILYTVRFAVPLEVQADFDDWYDSEHIPMALGSPHWTLTRRYRFEADEPHWTHLAVHHLADVRAVNSPQMKAARLTPWRAKFASQPWFQASERIIALNDD